MERHYVIVDASVKRMGAKNTLEESLYYVDTNNFVIDFKKAKAFPDTNSAIEKARELNQELPVKVLLIQNEGNRVGIGEIKF